MTEEQQKIVSLRDGVSSLMTSSPIMKQGQRYLALTLDVWFLKWNFGVH